MWALLYISLGVACGSKDRDLERVRAVDAWVLAVTNGSAAKPPPWWRVTHPSDLENSAYLAEGHEKTINTSTLWLPVLGDAGCDFQRRRRLWWWEKKKKKEKKQRHDVSEGAAVELAEARVVVKAQKRGSIYGGEAHLELLFLEYLRGQHGVPALYGAWVTDSGHVAYAVGDAGAPLGSGKGTRKSPSVIAVAIVVSSSSVRRSQSDVALYQTWTYQSTRTSPA